MKTNNNTITATTTSMTSLEALIADAKMTKAKRAEEKAKKANKNATVPFIPTVPQSIVTQGILDMQKYGYDWFQAMIPIEYIEEDMPYQRPLNIKRVNEIVDDFKTRKVGGKLVNYRPDTDRFYMMDGRHTLNVLKRVGKTHIPCHVFIDLSYEMEATIFGEQYDGCVKVNTKDTFNAHCEAKEDNHVTIMKVLKDFGVELNNSVGLRRVRSVKKLKTIMENYGEQGLRFVFQLIEDTGWGATDGKAYVESTLNIGYYAFPECLKKNGTLNKTKYNCLIKILKQYPTSTLYAVRGYNYCETTTKHPEYAIKYVIQEDLAEATVQAQKVAEYRKNYYESYVKM